MSAKAEILNRVRSALADVPDTPVADDVPIAWGYGRPVEVGDVVDVFAERVEDYKATVVRCGAHEVTDAVVSGLRATGATSVVVPPGLDPEWVGAIGEAGLQVRTEEPGQPLSSADLNGVDAVVTASAVGIAETGTIVLDHGPDQGRRAFSLVPDRHVCVVRADQVVSAVAEAVARLKPAVEQGRPLTWISGPSATSDIELSRVEGVHGPRTLYVVIAG